MSAIRETCTTVVIFSIIMTHVLQITNRSLVDLNNYND